MKFQENSEVPGYFKIMRVSLEPDSCRVLKGPQEEKKLAEFLRDDFHSSRYEKMLQLVVREMVEESDRESISKLLSLEHLREEFSSGGTEVTCSYQRKINGQMQPVVAEVFPKKFGKQGELVEFMLYVSPIENEK